MLQEEFLTPLCLSQYALAKAIELSPRRINEIVRGDGGYRAARHAAGVIATACRALGK